MGHLWWLACSSCGHDVADRPLIALELKVLHISHMPRLPSWIVLLVAMSASSALGQAAEVAPVEVPVDGEADGASAVLHELEARLATGGVDIATDTERVRQGLIHVEPRVRAQAAHVAAWLSGEEVVGMLLVVSGDPDERVRLAATQSLSFLVRRSNDPQRQLVRARLLQGLDDPADAVACAAIEWTANDDPAAAIAILTPRAELANDVRYACLRRVLPLPPRSVSLPSASVATKASVEQPIAAEPALISWLSLATGVVAGATIGAAIPTAWVPSRDVLVYTPRQSRYFRQSSAFAAQVGAALGGAVLLGGANLALDLVLGTAPPAAQLSVALATGAGALAGASTGFVLATPSAEAVGLGIGTAVGFFGGVAMSRLSPPSPHAIATAASVGAVSGLGSALTVFTILPVNAGLIGRAERTEFAIGVAAIGVGAGTLVGLGCAPFVEVTAARALVIAAGALAGAGVVGGVAFAAVPNIEVKSRIAAGVSLGGLMLGAVGGFFWPASWLPDAPVDVAVVPSVATIAIGTDVVTTIGALGTF
jgi:hypothetical protein